MKSGLFISLLVISTLSFALVQSDFEAKQFFKEQGARHSDFIEAADTLIIDCTQVIPKGSLCISLPIKATVNRHIISCFKETVTDSTTTPGTITIWTKKRPLSAVLIKKQLYIGRSFKEIANEMLSKKVH